MINITSSHETGTTQHDEYRRGPMYELANPVTESGNVEMASPDTPLGEVRGCWVSTPFLTRWKGTLVPPPGENFPILHNDRALERKEE